jgi:hypothetical protein
MQLVRYIDPNHKLHVCVLVDHVALDGAAEILFKQFFQTIPTQYMLTRIPRYFRGTNYMSF